MWCAGIDLGKAYDVPPNLKSEQFYAAVVLKVNLASCVLFVLSVTVMLPLYLCQQFEHFVTWAPLR